MESKFINSNGIKMHTESFGQISNSAVLLIMGATAQSLMWPEWFCRELADSGYYVIRYDHRDTGQSDRIDFSAAPYDLETLSLDASNVLREYGIKQAHFVGASMGSFIAQINAIRRPQMVKTLTCIMTSPKHTVFIDGFVKNNVEHFLPGSHPKILDFYEEILSISASSVDEDYKLHKKAWLKIENSEELLDVRIFEGKILKRLKNHKYIHNHSYALANSPSIYEEIHKITAPTLIIHGEHDYILPVEHARELHKILPSSRLIVYSAMGHCLTKKVLQNIKLNVLEHFEE